MRYVVTKFFAWWVGKKKIFQRRTCRQITRGIKKYYCFKSFFNLLSNGPLEFIGNQNLVAEQFGSVKPGFQKDASVGLI